MSTNYHTIFERRYLAESLPEPLTPRDEHWQIFDNYIENTRIRLRKIRVPESGSWTKLLEMQDTDASDDCSTLRVNRMMLNTSEYKTFEYFKGNEIRKNRYFCKFEDVQLGIDVFLGKLWGLNVVRAEFTDKEEFARFIRPDFATVEVTGIEFFRGFSLFDKTLDDVRREIAKL